MTTALEIKNRKNTTKAALKALETLITSFDGKFEADVNRVISGEFYGKVTVSNYLSYSDFNFARWTNYSVRWEISNGVLELKSIGEDGEPHKYHDVFIEDLRQINFSKAISELENIITKYNKISEKKDQQIENFLKFCTDFKAAKEKE